MASQFTYIINHKRQSLRILSARLQASYREWCWNCSNISSQSGTRKAKNYMWQTLCPAQQPTIPPMPPCWPFNVNVQSDLLCKSPALIYVLLCWNAGMCKCEFWGARACELHIATNWGTASCVSLMPCLHETRFREINAFHNSKMWRSTIEMLIYLR